jgi:hypothetical protein
MASSRHRTRAFLLNSQTDIQKLANKLARAKEKTKRYGMGQVSVVIHWGNLVMA